MLTTLAFALFTLWSVYTLIKERHATMNRWNYWSAALVTALHAGVALYLASYGLIGVRTWA